MKKSALLCFLCSIAASQISYAEYRIKDAIESAKEHNFGMHIEQNTLDKAKLSRADAVSGFWPKAVVSANLGKQAGKYDRTAQGFVEKGSADRYNLENVPTLRTATVQVEQELFTGGSSVFSIQKVEKGLKAAEFEYQNNITKLYFEVIRAYYEVFMYRRIYQIRLSKELTSRNFLEKLETRLEIREITKTDVSSARSNLAHTTAQREEAFGVMKNKEAFLAYKVGLNPREKLSEIKYSGVELPNSLDDLLVIVKKNNPQVEAARNSHKAAQYDVKVSESELLPRVTANFALSRANSSDRNEATSAGSNYNSASLNVSVPIFNRGLTLTNIKRKRYDLRKSNLTLQDAEVGIESNAIEAWSEYQTSKAQLISTRSAELSAQEAYDGVQEEFDAGTKSTLDLLKVESDLFDRKVDHEGAKSKVVMSIFKMKALSGELDKMSFEGL